jgi:hypothetical protein
MTPKQKAQELYSTFANTLPDAVEIDKDVIKDCARIVCKYVLSDMGADRGYEFWTSVKEEIEKL